MLSQLLTNYPTTFAFVQIHHGDDYATTWGNQRANFYTDFDAYPTSYFDGTLRRRGAYAYSTYQSDYLTRRGVTTNVTMHLTGDPVSGQTYRVQAKVCVEAGGVATPMRIYIVQVLDHWPTVVSYSRNGFKQAATTQDMTLSPGQCQTIVRDFTFDADSWGHQSDITIIAWAQEPQDSSPPSNRAEVFQAAIMRWPFPTADCNNNGIPDDQDIAAGTSKDCQPNLVPDECELTGNDCNANSIPDDCEASALITGHPTNQTPCPDGTAIFNVSAVGSPGYRWYKGESPLSDGGNILGADTSMLTVSNVSAPDAGSYKCKVSLGCIQSFSNPATLALAAAPAVTQQPTNLTKCQGQSASFVAQFSGTTPLSYQWQKWSGSQYEDMPGQHANTLYFASVQPSDAGSYRCRASNACGQATSNAANLSVTATPTITDQPDDTCVEVGGTAVFHVTAGGGTVYYWWRKNGSGIWGAFSDTLTLTNVQPGDAADYDVLLSFTPGFECTSISEPATLTVGDCGCIVPGDLDADADVDLHDFALFQACFGSGMGLVPGCQCADMNTDDNVDLADYVLWEPALVGPT